MMTTIHLPMYKDGFRVKNEEPIEIDITDYAVEINTIQDFKDKILNKLGTSDIESYNKIKDDIDNMVNNNTILPNLTENRKLFEERIELILFDYDENTKQKYKEQINNAIQFIKKVNNKSSSFIVQNKDEIKNEIDEFKKSIVHKLKENRKTVNKKYYENRKQKLDIPVREKLTEEQKKENKKLANQKYRETQKQLKESNEPIEEITPTERKKQYNQTYYQKQKDLKEKIKQLENELKELKNPN